MGTDISFFVEVKKNDRWVTADQWEKRGQYYHVPLHKRFYGDRNYLLFNVLGLSDNDQIISIVNNRGLPNNLCNELKEYFSITDHYDINYLILHEIVDYPWDEFDYTINDVYVPDNEIKLIEERGYPNIWHANEPDDIENYILVPIIEIPLSIICNFTKTIEKLKELVVDNNLDSVRIVYGFN